MLESRAEIEDSWRSDDGEFVPAVIRGDAQDGSQDEARIRIGGSRSTTRLDHLFGVFQEFCNVQAHDGGGHPAGAGERGIASTDARNAKKYLREFVRFSDLLHLGARIGGGDV